MASSFPPLQVEDQTDEEFFDKLVDDDYGAGQSQSNPGEMVRGLSNLRLGDVEGSGFASDADGWNDNEPVDISGAAENDASVTAAKSGVLSEEASCGAKGTSFKEVQWSAFSIDLQQFGQVGFESDLFLGSADVSLANSQTGSEAKSTFTEFAAENISSFTGMYKQQDAHLYSPVCEKAANLTEMQNWENLYPGWKYDGNTEQWYQLDGHDATTKTQSDHFCSASANPHDAFEYKVQNAFEVSISERLDALHLQRTRHAVLETISESSFLNRWNQVSQGSIEYPPNMVFDPQYPECYYDTITQQWYTLESYNDVLYNASSGTQGQQNANVNASAGSTIADRHASNGSAKQSEGYVPQENSSQESRWTASANGFGQQSMWQEQNTQGHAYGSGDDLQQICQQQTGQQSHWEASVSGSDQKKMWQPEMEILQAFLILS